MEGPEISFTKGVRKLPYFPWVEGSIAALGAEFRPGRPGSSWRPGQLAAGSRKASPERTISCSSFGRFTTILTVTAVGASGVSG